MPRNNARQYNRIRSSPDEETAGNDGRQDINNGNDNDDDDEGMETIELASRGTSSGGGAGTRNHGIVGRRRLPAPSYERIAAHDNNDPDLERGDGTDSLSSSRRSSSSSPSSSTAAAPEEELIPITILDFAQQTFPMKVSPHWTVAQLKQQGVAVHRVPVSLQRLVYSGKLLLDDSTLAESGVSKSGAIVHLFPRPRVVIQEPDAATVGPAESNENSTTTVSSPSSGSGGGGGARVPTIVLDADEAQQRSQILVLGSVEYLEAQNNVKLFSFMLLVISAIELLNLLALALGVPPDDSSSSSSSSSSSLYPSDDIPTYDDAGYQYWNTRHSQNGTSDSSQHHTRVDPNLVLYESWGWPNTIDLIISAAGVYVALLGIQASNDNARRLAKQYMFGTVVVGIGWMLFNYYVTIRIDRAVADQQHDRSSPSNSPSPYNPIFDNNNDDTNNLYTQALSVMVLPGLVWVLCCLRAAQFHHLLHEAEEEARDRIRSQMEVASVSETLYAEDDSPSTTTTTTTTTTAHSSSSRGSGSLPVVTVV